MNRSGIDANESVAHRSSGALPLNYLQRYGLAVVSIGVALGISLLLQHFGFRVPSALLLLFAVAISSWYAGAGPAVLAAILSTISFYWYFVEPVHTIYIYRSQIPFFVIFTAFAALLSRFGTFRQRAEADLRRTHDQLKVERPKLGSRTIALLYFAFSSCWILFTDRLVHGLGLSNAYLLKVSEAKGILFISLSTLLMYVLVEKALRQRHSVATAYWQLVETAQEGVWSVDAEGKTVFANENMAAILGTSPGEMIGKSILPFVPQEKKDELLNHLLQREQGLQEHYEFPFLRADGAQVWTLLRASPVLRDGQHSGSLALVSDITKRKRTEEALRQSEAYLTEAQRLTHTGSWAFDIASDRYVYVSEECLRVFGFDSQEVSPTREVVFRRIHPDDSERVNRGFEKSVHEKVDTSNEFRIVLPDGAVKTVHVTRHPVLNSAGDVVKLTGAAVDITERKRAEEALSRSESYLAEAQRLSHTGSWALDVASGNYVYSSEEYIRISGFDPQQGLPAKDQPLQQIHPDDVDKFWQAFQKLIDEKVDSEGEYRIVLPDGTVKYVHAIRHPVLNANGELVEVVGTTIDITERKRAEEALRRSEAYLAESQRLTQTGSFAYIPGGAVLYWSEEALRIWGFDQQQAILSHEMVRQRIHPDDRGRARERAEKALGTKTDWYDEFRIVLPDGTVKHIHAIHHPVFSASGELVEVVGTHVDVTERKRAEEALRESETRFRTFVDHAGDALFVQDFEQGTVVDVNRQASESLGYTRQELIGKAPLAFHLDSDRAEMESAAERAAAGETVVDTHRHRRKDGTVFPVEANTSSFCYGGRRFLLQVARDISDRVQAEEQRERLRQLEADLAHINRVSMMGELAASIAHEVNQPLSGVVSNGSACLRWLAGDAPNMEEAREAARRIVRDGKRAGEVIARIRALTKKISTPREKLDLNETLRQVLALVGDEATRRSVNIRTKFADDLSPVSGDQVQLQQVVLNLAMNAIEAMSSIGERARELVITTRNIDTDQVQVTVEDSGVGLDPNTMPKIFEPFYTTKPTGMGMGLSISRSILQAHGGRLWATAKDGPGTIFYFTLPKYHEEESHAGVSAA